MLRAVGRPERSGRGAGMWPQPESGHEPFHVAAEADWPLQLHVVPRLNFGVTLPRARASAAQEQGRGHLPPEDTIEDIGRRGSRRTSTTGRAVFYQPHPSKSTASSWSVGPDEAVPADRRGW